MLLDLYINEIGDINIYDMPSIYQSLIISFIFFFGVGIGLLDIILFPIEFIIWFIKENFF